VLHHASMLRATTTTTAAAAATVKSSSLQKASSSSLTDLVEKHQINIPGFLILSVIVLSTLHVNTAIKCLTLQYPVKTAEGLVLYGKGRDDLLLVGFSILAVTCLRACAMNYVFKPMALWLNVVKPEKVTRFCEQGWTVIYNSASWLFGLWLYVDSPYFLDMRHIWMGYPHQFIPGPVKYYYLVSLGVWIQQFLVIHLEKRRKDYLAMLTHHVITVALLSLSYIANCTRIGHAILFTMDLSDIFMALAKMQRYAGFEFACAISFGLFTLSWLVMRLYLYFQILFSAAIDTKRYPVVKWDPENGFFMSEYAWYGFAVLLVLLYGLMIYWFIEILKVISKALSSNQLDDTRSDSESDSEEAESKEKDD